jgi:hypothetical protein
MSDYLIQILVRGGQRDGVKIYTRPVDWAGEVITFPRYMTKELKTHVAENTNGIYVLWSVTNGIYSIYVGKSDNIVNRIQQHQDGKNFWTNALVMVSNNNILNAAHVSWIESNLVNKVTEISQHKVMNGNKPSDPKLNLQDKSLASAFLDRLEEMLPIIGLPLFESSEEAELAVDATQTHDLEKTSPDGKIDTLIVPTGKSGEGFEEVFLNEHCWYYLRISPNKAKNFKFIAAYRPAPISAVTHIAEIAEFVEVENEKGQTRLKAVFKEPARELFGEEVKPFGDAKGGSMQGPRYVNCESLMACTQLGEIL